MRFSILTPFYKQQIKLESQKSHMELSDSRNIQKILQQKQALIPQKYKKTLEAKALMDHYQNNELQKMYNQRSKLQQKIQEMQMSKKQNLRHLYEIQLKKQIKQNTKNEYAKDYDQMISLRKQRQQEEKQKELWLEQKLLSEDSWLRDQNQQRQIEKMKKIQYAKELEKHLKMQEQKRNEEAARIKEQRDRAKREAFEQQRKSMLERRQQQTNLAMKDILSWSQTHEDLRQFDGSNNPLTPKMDQMLKVQQQKYYQKGRSVQFKNEHQKKYFQRHDPQKSAVPNYQKHQSYNPITNPIPYKYKNPNILKVLSSYS